MEKLWNDTCRMVERFRKTGARGQDFRASVVKVFEQLGWSRETDISLDTEIPIGVTKSISPDLVISNDSTKCYVVELKRPSAQIKNRDAEQLFSYMRLLQLDFGLLMGESLRFYYDDPTDTKQPVLIADVSFEPDDEEGIEIFRLFSKRGFDVFGLTHYCEAVMVERKRQERIKGIANTLCSLKGKRFIRDVVRAQLQKQYPADIVRDVMRRIDINAFLRNPADADKTDDEVLIEEAEKATYEVSGAVVEEDEASSEEVSVEATIIEDPVDSQEIGEEEAVAAPAGMHAPMRGSITIQGLSADPSSPVFAEQVSAWGMRDAPAYSRQDPLPPHPESSFQVKDPVLHAEQEVSDSSFTPPVPSQDHDPVSSFKKPLVLASQDAIEESMVQSAVNIDEEPLAQPIDQELSQHPVSEQLSVSSIGPTVPQEQLAGSSEDQPAASEQPQEPLQGHQVGVFPQQPAVPQPFGQPMMQPMVPTGGMEQPMVPDQPTSLPLEGVDFQPMHLPIMQPAEQPMQQPMGQPGGQRMEQPKKKRLSERLTKVFRSSKEA